MIAAFLGAALAAWGVLGELDDRQAKRFLGAPRRPALPRSKIAQARSLLGGASLSELPLRSVQALSFAVVLVFVWALLARSLSLTLLSVALAVVIGYAWTLRRRWTLAARIEGQLPDAASLMASAIAAGANPFQSLQAAAAETPNPLGGELARAVQRVELNTTLERSLRILAEDVGSKDLSALVAAISIARVTGGNLARLLRDTTDFLRDEQRLRADARALSAQARYSAQMIGVMPLALFTIFESLFPSYVTPLTTTTVGLAILAYCGLSTALGFYVIWRIATGIEQQ